MVNIRTPFSGELTCRDTSLEKDQLITNAFIDQVPEGMAVVKRPGLENKTSALGLGISGALGLGLGIIFYNNKVYSWNSIDPGTVWGGFIASSDTLVSVTYTNAAFAPPYLDLYINTNDEINTKELPTISSSNTWSAILYSGTRFIIAGRNSSGANKTIGLSTDGINWTTVLVTVPTSLDMRCGAKKGSTICILDEHLDYTIISTDDGNTWTVHNPAIDDNDGIYTVAASGTVFSTGEYYSTDGITWSTSTGSPGSNSNILYDGTRFFSVVNGIIYTSTTGSTWTNTTATGSGAVALPENARVAWNGSRYVAMGDGWAAYSTNGIAWTLSNRTYSPTVLVDEIIYFNNNFYALSHSPSVLSGAPFNISFIEKSSNGVNWTRTIIDVALFDENPTIISGLT